MILEILKAVFVLILVLVILALPILIAMFIIAVWDKELLGIGVAIIGYAIMFSAVFVIDSSELTGIGEVIGMEYVPPHNETSIRTQPTVINGKTSIITLPSNKHKEEAYVIHVRKKTDSKYKRYMLEVPEEKFEDFELGEEVDLSEYEKYD